MGRKRFSVVEYSDGYAVRDNTTGDEKWMSDGVDVLTDKRGRSLSPGTESFRRKWEKALNESEFDTADAYFEGYEENPRKENVSRKKKYLFDEKDQEVGGRNMARKPYGYNVSGRGTIEDPGKFEGEMYFVPHFWNEAMEGGSNAEVDSQDGHQYSFIVFTPADKKKFKELRGDYGMALWESDQGFVMVTYFKTKADYEDALEYAELRDDEEEET